jgi:hypothetical protein
MSAGSIGEAVHLLYIRFGQFRLGKADDLHVLVRGAPVVLRTVTLGVEVVRVVRGWTPAKVRVCVKLGLLPVRDNVFHSVGGA